MVKFGGNGYMAMVFALMMVVNMTAEAAVTCGGEVHEHAVVTCRPFVSFGQQKPSNECCSAYKAFRAMATNTTERKELCFCVQRVANLNLPNKPPPSVRIPKVDALHEQCGFPFTFSADRNKFDCNNVN